jgi:Fe-Mn family superoxide dismutase
MKLPYKSIPGLVSAEALAAHVALADGYAASLARVDKALDSASLPSKRTLEHPFNALKRAETYAIGGVLLHDLYFGNLCPGGISPHRDMAIVRSLSERFGGVQEWWAHMRATALSANGWAVTAVCEVDPSDIRIFLCDQHDMGASFGYSPIVILDVYEHSFWIDFPNDRARYLDACVHNLEWREIERRFVEACA